MALTSGQKKNATRRWITKMFVEANATATWPVDHLQAVVSAIDAFFEASIATLNDAQSVEQALNAALPQPFRGAATLEQKALATAYWAMQRGGLLPDEE